MCLYVYYWMHVCSDGDCERWWCGTRALRAAAAAVVRINLACSLLKEASMALEPVHAETSSDSSTGQVWRSNWSGMLNSRPAVRSEVRRSQSPSVSVFSSGTLRSISRRWVPDTRTWERGMHLRYAHTRQHTTARYIVYTDSTAQFNAAWSDSF